MAVISTVFLSACHAVQVVSSAESLVKWTAAHMHWHYSVSQCLMGLGWVLVFPSVLSFSNFGNWSPFPKFKRSWHDIGDTIVFYPLSYILWIIRVLCVCVYLWVCTCVSVCVPVCISVCISVCLCICVYLCVCISVCLCVYLCVHICVPMQSVCLHVQAGRSEGSFHCHSPGAAHDVFMMGCFTNLELTN